MCAPGPLACRTQITSGAVQLLLEPHIEAIYNKVLRWTPMMDNAARRVICGRLCGVPIALR